MTSRRNEFEDSEGSKTGRLETSRAFDLLAEYSKKLNEICKDEVARRRYRIISFAAGFISTGLFSLLSITLFDVVNLEYFTQLNGYEIGVLFTFIFSIILFLMLYVFLSGSPGKFYAGHLAAIIERLVNSASQYNEHGATTLMEQFEFDLRLAEADAALRVYHDVFRVRSGPAGIAFDKLTGANHH